MGSRTFIRLPNFLKPNFIICSPRIKRLLFCHIFNVQKKILAVWRSFAKDQTANATLQNIDLADMVAILFTSDRRVWAEELLITTAIL
jgi:limonene-1,2-epoxide hydrolase